ncbi:flagellar assembly peptidoglycan hydrolase FlgJ [Pseudomonas sp. GD03721]|uniref:Peptidoglycan hydrolase FlgJ n=1 Tax=Ectopseudomonas chengduensis TaxID=489632 RepID=A0A1G6NIF5_9GAMM|nr:MULTISPECIES: flagellar assembly peptidoglycan hydrolase FlgJ [Pseudomonas]MBA4681200.1 flagellar assembly peptidoglycan hydrolase FlgJ [Pseudomonas sp.]KQO31171.1 flagellar biosynthesis protein FlgJ [Pseudomonas sp. Leaf83]MBP3061727.1 flagellar assembly peptidoglycan hydrolase FlgJ [Pseudomonas chengduensis]MDG9978139.1 flagellar assembly peptidoglycan hydrolase FlgJ [Pseudomonas oleovorans]MDH0957821.1 flagellar assembly peptidoglycan hydrolase FlgJ [Pseudomonas chengduensis]
MNTLLGGTRTVSDSGAYTDLNRLAGMKNGEQRDSEGNVRRVAQEFEALFINQIFKSMRSANEAVAKDSLFDSDTTRHYQEMHDQQLSISLSREGGGIGLADVLVRQMSRLRGEPARSSPFGTVVQQGESGADKASSKNADEAPVSQAALLNRRRLSLPSRLEDRLLAGIVSSSEGQLNNGADWVAKKDSSEKALAEPQKTTPRSVAQPPLAKGKAAFASAQDFVQTMLPLAQEAADRIGVEPHYLVAQAALETGWGKSILRRSDGDSSFNLFGIKTHGQWQGEAARAVTSEYREGQMVRETASFRAYDSYKQSFHDLVDFLQSNPRYQNALSKTDNSETFVRELQAAGYATDPQYARKINQIARKIDATYQTIARSDVATTRTL